MSLLSDEMIDLDRPVTRHELRQELEAILKTLVLTAIEETVEGLAARIRAIELGYGRRLLSLEGRVTRLEKRRT